jgi:hypothetical protein
LDSPPQVLSNQRISASLFRGVLFPIRQ